MKIVVTGGAGFIGSHFVKHILRKYPDYRIRNIDKLTYAGNPENLKEVAADARYEFIKEDICNRSGLEKIIPGWDAVVNFAAESHVDRSLMEPEVFLKTDVLGTFNLLEVCRHARVSKYVQISTDEVYGSIPEGSFSEESPLNPSNPYSASKAAADLLALSYFRTHGLPVQITRSTNNYGPNQYPEKFMPLFITNALEDKPVPVYGDGRQRREWLFAEDNCAAIDLILHQGKAGQIYNVSAGQEHENILVARSILGLLAKPESLLNFVRDRPGHDRRYSITSQKIRELGWQPAYSFEEGLELTVQWYRDNTAWWKKIKEGSFREYYQKQYGAG